MNHLSEKENTVLKQIMDENGLTVDTLLYRYQAISYMETGSDGYTYIRAKENPLEIVIDPYHGEGHSFHASNIGPGLAFTSSREEEFSAPDKVCLQVKIGNILEQGGLLYRITSVPEYINAYFLTIPDGKVRAQVCE